MDVIEGCKIKVSSSTIDTCLFQRSHLLLTFFLQVRILSKFRVFQILSRKFRGKNGNLEGQFGQHSGIRDQQVSTSSQQKVHN